MEVRLLESEDAPRLERFLLAHRDSSMFLRSNARRCGLVDRGEPFQATYAGALHDGDLLGVVAHAWNGMVTMQAPVHVAELARTCVAWTGRKVTGFSGLLSQVQQARAALALTDAPARLDSDEGLYALPLVDVRVPSNLTSGSVECRAPRPEERELLRAWRVAYDIEVLGATDSAETRNRSAGYLDAQLADGNVWIAIEHETPVSLAAFNAALPDIVQLGGIYTPPELRGRGYARAAVAASLLAAKDRGADRAVLFADSPSAIRCYTALGFRRIGDYGLVLLE